MQQIREAPPCLEASAGAPNGHGVGLRSDRDLRKLEALATLACVLLLIQLSLFSLSGVAQEVPSVSHSPRSPEITFHTSSDLVLVDVTALNAKDGLPDDTLKRRDFQIFDNGHRVAIRTFESGAQSAARPLALWFIVLCNMQGYEKQGSGFFAGHAGVFKPALKNLDPHDTMAVAHWCDDGQSKLDLLPTNNVERATRALDQALAPVPDTKDHDRPGELALEKTLQLIVDATRPLEPERLPAVIFLYGDHSGMPRSEADHLIDELLGTSAIAYGLKDRRSPGLWFLPGEQKEVAHYIATETGGQYFEVTPETYAKGLEEILQQLHSRYELGFKPDTLDGKRHKLLVKLSGAAKNKRKAVRLRYRTAYLAIRHGAT
jgi:hypothetical protein